MKSSRLKAKGRSVGEGRHIRLYRWLTDTVAWRDLGPVERALYLEMKARYAGPGTNNGRLPFSVREAAEALHIGKSKAAEAFLRLEQHGFIVNRQKGGFTCKVRHSSEWRLTEHACDVTGDLPTKDFTRWSPEMQKPVLQADRAVPERGPIGPPMRTELLEKRRYGT